MASLFSTWQMPELMAILKNVYQPLVLLVPAVLALLATVLIIFTRASFSRSGGGSSKSCQAGRPDKERSLMLRKDISPSHVLPSTTGRTELFGHLALYTWQPTIGQEQIPTRRESDSITCCSNVAVYLGPRSRQSEVSVGGDVGLRLGRRSILLPGGSDSLIEVGGQFEFCCVGTSPELDDVGDQGQIILDT